MSHSPRLGLHRPLQALDTRVTTRRQLPGALLILVDPTAAAVQYYAYGCLEDELLEPSITHMVRCVYAALQLRQPPPDIKVAAKAAAAVTWPRELAESYLVRDQLRYVYKVRLHAVLSRICTTEASTWYAGGCAACPLGAL